MNVTRSIPVPIRGAFVATFCLLILSLSGFAQAVSSTPPADLNKPDKEDVVILSPFEVRAEKENGYQVGDTLAGSRLRMKLSDVGAAVTVVNEQFMLDTGSKTAADMLIYTPGTEAAGMGGNFSGVNLGSGGYSDPAEYLAAPHRSTRVRGLNNADLTRDFFPTDIPMDSYNTSRVDISRGANSILFGLGSPAGIINNQLRTPDLAKNRYSASFEFSRYNSNRTVVDLNQMVSGAHLGVRVIGLRDHQNYQQKPAYENDERLFTSLRWEPRMVRNGFTQLTVNYENGKVEANRPRPTPPIDGLSVWFDVLNKLQLDPANTNQVNATSFLFSHLDAAGRSFSQPTAVFNDPASSAQGGTGVPAIMQTRGGIPYTQWWAVAGYNAKSSRPDFFLNTAYAPAGQAWGGLWREQEILDPTVFNFYDILIDGPNKQEGQKFAAFNTTFRQTFLQDTFGFEVAYDKQSFDTTQFFNALSFDQSRILVDMQIKLVDGSPNPNFGRPYVASDSIGNSIRENDRDSTRATVFANLDFTEKKGLLRYFGRHVATATYGNQNTDSFRRFYNGYGYTLDLNQYGSDPVQGTSFAGYQTWAGIHYLGSSIANQNSAHGANIGGITADQTPAGTATGLIYNRLISAWDQVPLTLIDSKNDLDKLYTSANRSSDKTTSLAAIWQAYLFNDKLVGLLGWRQDEFSLYNAGAVPVVPVTGQVDPFNPNWKLPSTPTIYVKDTAFAWSVVAHSPDFINRLLPRGTRFSLAYSKSQNFRPSAVVTDVYGRQFNPPSGQTEDASIAISLADDKFNLKLTKYKTTQANDQATFYPVFWAGNNIIRAMNGMRNANNNEALINRWFGFNPGDPNYFPLRASLSDPAFANNVNPPRTPAETAALRAWLDQRTDAEWLRPVDPLLAQAWQFTRNPSTGTWSATQPANSGNVADTVSEGWELEATYNPTRNWRMTFNAAKTEAVKTNFGADFAPFIEANKSLFEDGNGILAANVREQEGLEDIMHFNAFGPNGLGARYLTELKVPYLNALAANGAAVQELRKWRFNFISTYDFREGALRGVSVGGAARWQDKAAIGYAPTQNAAGVWVNDVTRPFYAPAELNFDFWVSYQRKIMNGRATWKIQLNVRDVFEKDRLIPVAAQPNGQVASARIASGNQWTLNNTFSF